jgi:hypothetical protein
MGRRQVSRPDARTGKPRTPARAANVRDGNARTRKIPAPIFDATERLFALVRSRPELVPHINRELEKTIARWGQS